MVDAVREESYAGRLAGEARAFRHPPSPLQEEVNRVIVACTYVMLPLAVLLLLTLKLRNAGLDEAAQTATAGLVTLIPEGLVLLMSVTFAVAAVRLAQTRHAGPADERHREPRRGRHDLRRQDRDADRRRAAAGRGRVRRGGRRRRRRTPRWPASPPAPATATAPWRRSPSASRARPGRVGAEVPFSSEWKWSGLALAGRDGGATYVLGRARRPRRGAAPSPCPPASPRKLEARDRGRAAASSPSAESGEALPADPGSEPPPRLAPLALVVLEETLRPDAAETIAFMREQEVDLKLISGDARATVTAVAYAVGVPRDAGVIEGPDLPEDPEELAEVGARQHDLLPDQARAEESAGRRPGRRRAATWR